ncbi:nitroreductase family protein [Mycobacterium sp.]|uniref:nitroreductase family protein n=1 Tax=Mycobacterium sp. TaxID=1785 RepID=UPI003BAEFB11
MDIYDVMRTTFAARAFTDDPLPDDVLERILDNARFAPSGGNRQGARVIVIRDHATREALAELSMTGARRYTAQMVNGESPWNPLHEPGPTAEEIAATDVPAQFTSPFVNAAVVLAVCVNLEVVAAMDQHLDRVGVISGGSVYPLVWNILLAARNEGFGGTISTMAVAEEPKVRELLGVPETYALAALVPLGKPVKQLTKLRRASVGEFATRERFDGEPFG